jgi:hypothetical protein
MDSIEFAFHTDSPVIQEICRKYWARGTDGKFLFKVSAIADASNIPTSRVAALVTEQCTAYDPNESCSRCHSRRPFASRADFLNRRGYRSPGAWVCSTCVDSERRTREQERRFQAQRGFDLIRLELEEKRNPGLATSSLSFRNVVYLVSLLRACGSQDLSSIAPIESVSSPPLSPSAERDGEILLYLYHRGLICVHPGSREEAVEIKDGRFNGFYPQKVHWILPTPEGKSPISILEELEQRLREGSFAGEWQVDADRLHRETALDECSQYLRIVMEEHRFEPPLGEKTQAVLRAVLRNFSIGQSYNFIWRAAKDAASFYLREQTSRTHAANIVPGAIQRMAERALAQGWPTNSFRRDFRAPLSVVSHVLFTLALHLPDDGFTTVPPGAETASADLNHQAVNPSTNWMAIRSRLAKILYSDEPLRKRYQAIHKEFETLKGRDALSNVRMEFDSMARSAADNRERPFRIVGKDLLTYCDSELYRELEARGEDPRWITELRRHEQEQTGEEMRREAEEYEE